MAPVFKNGHCKFIPPFAEQIYFECVEFVKDANNFDSIFNQTSQNNTKPKINSFVNNLKEQRIKKIALINL